MSERIRYDTDDAGSWRSDKDGYIETDEDIGCATGKLAGEVLQNQIEREKIRRIVRGQIPDAGYLVAETPFKPRWRRT